MSIQSIQLQGEILQGSSLDVPLPTYPYGKSLYMPYISLYSGCLWVIIPKKSTHPKKTHTHTHSQLLSLAGFVFFPLHLGRARSPRALFVEMLQPSYL